MATQLPQDLERLRDSLALRLAGCRPAYKFAADIIVKQLNSIWDDEQGVEMDVELLNATLSPKFDAVLSASGMSEVEQAVDGLVVAWSAVAPHL